MREIVARGTIRLDGTKDADGEGIVCNFKGSDVIKKMSLDLASRAKDVPYKEDLSVQVIINKAQMTIDDVASDGGVF